MQDRPFDQMEVACSEEKTILAQEGWKKGFP